MVTVVDLTSELGRLTMLEGRTPQTTSAERKGSSAQLGAYRDGQLFTSKFSGKGAWERHPNGDELVHILDGTATLEIVTIDGPSAIALGPGMLAVVPQGAWHRFLAPEGVTLMTATPLPTEHIRDDVDDPRSPAEKQG